MLEKIFLIRNASGGQPCRVVSEDWARCLALPVDGKADSISQRLDLFGEVDHLRDIRCPQNNKRVLNLALNRHRVFNRGFELFEAYGFHQMFGKACIDTFLNIPVHTEAADGDAADSRFCAQVSHKFRATPIR